MKSTQIRMRAIEALLVIHNERMKAQVDAIHPDVSLLDIIEKLRKQP